MEAHPDEAVLNPGVDTRQLVETALARPPREWPARPRVTPCGGVEARRLLTAWS